MVILAVAYLVVLWLLFSKFKLIRLTWVTGTVAAAVGTFILGVFLALLNYLTPTGRIVVGSRVVEVTPNASGEVIAIPVKTNVPVTAGSVLFEIDPTPFKYKVAQLEVARITAFGGTSAYPAEISIPRSADRSMLRLGISGTATLFAENADAIGLIARILLWIRAYTAYL